LAIVVERYFDKTSISLLRDEQEIFAQGEDLMSLPCSWERIFHNSFGW
jgi:hypothetical protein